MDPGSYPLLIHSQNLLTILNPEFTFSVTFIAEIIALFTLLLISGFISGAETAFFAISPVQLFELKESQKSRYKLVYDLLERPKRLLATLLITINFVNIAIVVLSSILIEQIFDFRNHQTVGFMIQVVAVTFVIVLFCEVMPKVYATQNPLRSSLKSVYPIFALSKILRPLSTVLIASTSIVDRRFGQKGYDISVDELTHAIDITSDKSTPEEEKKILKGIARFGNIDVKQIMKSRMDVVAFDKNLKFSELFPLILENRYSRVPVYENSFDTVIGVLCIKDLLPYLDLQNDDTFEWQKQMRPAYFVPESKKINDLLQEFQEKKNHLAIVIDEYGGSSGIVTLEDVLEEIVGEINDEFDDDELTYSKLDDHNFVFEGKTNLNDICRIMEIDHKLLEVEESEVDSLAGLILEIMGSIPMRNEVVKLNDIIFTIESADKKRIKRVKITLPEKKVDSNGNGGFTGMTSLNFVLLFLMSTLLFSCEQEYNPKPRGYFRIEVPEKKYELFKANDCTFSFEIPVYAQVIKDTLQSAEPCWYNVEWTKYKGTLYLSHKEVNNNLAKFINDSQTLSMKHIAKASGMQEEEINVPSKKVYGFYTYVKGNAASAVQFYLTDSSKHFIRGALYFYAIPNPDSIAPVLSFVEEDVKHLVSTFSWK
ncbi:MAG TPA: gliding motility lipoprotein GldD [Bacteroidia bacterium]|nr:gliding motility lipoprotein GldD [Bacteroidia bacterium]MBP9789662.1 gliding motility lipoprotein GldD [Bacteroidia bacterium]MBP9923277.1 gliding motility lipoprotein GldD [Bacteroidia bacterium]HQV98910.1 gliding motility lipoprotein GldD [Bacteroidia bacterium]HQW23093.1 gliding motility lipoprotein GldD [Bacteroidia bacterium]